MTKLQTIGQQIDNKKAELETIKGSECEVFTRIVGYYRPVKNFNAGQDAQRKERKNYEIKL